MSFLYFHRNPPYNEIRKHSDREHADACEKCGWKNGGGVMKYAADFRAEARDALRGKWFLAVLTGLAAVLLGGTGIEGPEFRLQIESGSLRADFDFGGVSVYSFDGPAGSDIGRILAASAAYLTLGILIFAVIYFILGGIIEIGYTRFNLNLMDRRKASFGDLFSGFSIWNTAIAVRFLQTLYVVLWSLLLVIPGIIATYSYAMTDYILAEHPELTASEAIRQSKEMMSGRRWRLFCLHLSFIGWGLLCILTLGIGTLWLVPYMHASEAAFYREISGASRYW